jgi:hypothetical protein
LKRILPTGDLAFKKVLASEEHKDILCGLIGDFFDIYVPVNEITIETPYSIDAYKEFVKGEEAISLRQTIKDVAASFKTADFISEIQVSKTRFFDERILMYLFERFCKNYNKAGSMQIDIKGKHNRYSSLRPVYSLNIIGHNHFSGDDEALRIFELYDPKRGKKFNKDLVKLGFFELGKNRIETVNQRHWRDYFTEGEVSADAPEYIKKACQVIEVANLSEEEKKVTTLLEKAQADLDAQISSSYLYGMEDKAEQRAKILLSDGFKFEMVSKYTGLSLEAIQKLQV